MDDPNEPAEAEQWCSVEKYCVDCYRKEDMLASNSNLFISMMQQLQRSAYHNSKEKGFWTGLDNSPIVLAGKVALMHSELSECVETIRKGDRKDDHCPEFNNGVIELADAIIRIMDLCGRLDWPLGEAILAKMTYNTSRPPMHGKTC